MSAREDLARFRELGLARDATAVGRAWRVIDTGGEGPVLVMLPGTLGSADIFWNQVESLPPDVRVISLSYPLVADVDWLADGLAALLRGLGISKASVLGSSFGGFLAQVFAERHGDMVEAMFVANSLSDPGMFRGAFPAPWLFALMPAMMLRKRMAAGIDRWPETDASLVEIKALLRDELFNRLPAAAPKARLLALVRSARIPDPQIDPSRVVVIDSDDDPLIPSAAREDVRRRFAQGTRHTFDSGGHFPYITRSVVYSGVIRDRLRRL